MYDCCLSVLVCECLSLCLVDTLAMKAKLIRSDCSKGEALPQCSNITIRLKFEIQTGRECAGSANLSIPAMQVAGLDKNSVQ